MCKRNGIRHQLGSLIDRISEHHSLIARSDSFKLLIGHLVLSCFKRLIDTHCNVGRLLIQCNKHSAGIAVEALFGRVISDINDGLSCDSLDIHIGLGCDLACDEDKSRTCCGLACNTAHGILFDHRIENGIRYCIADLIGMSFGNGLRCKQYFFHKKKILSGLRGPITKMYPSTSLRPDSNKKPLLWNKKRINAYQLTILLLFETNRSGGHLP